MQDFDTVLENIGQIGVYDMSLANYSVTGYYEYWSSEDTLAIGTTIDWTFDALDCWSWLFEMRPKSSAQGGFGPNPLMIRLGVKEALAGVISLSNIVNGVKPSVFEPEQRLLQKNKNRVKNKGNKLKCICGED